MPHTPPQVRLPNSSSFESCELSVIHGWPRLVDLTSLSPRAVPRLLSTSELQPKLNEPPKSVFADMCRRPNQRDLCCFALHPDAILLCRMVANAQTSSANHAITAALQLKTLGRRCPRRTLIGSVKDAGPTAKQIRAPSTSRTLFGTCAGPSRWLYLCPIAERLILPQLQQQLRRWARLCRLRQQSSKTLFGTRRRSIMVVVPCQFAERLILP
jgi:hypothetical protein